jgi:glycyl-tRNA synthetase beta chain
MAELLLEFFSEEIPARMQKRAEEDLAKLLGEELAAGGLGKPAMRTLSGPRRVAVIVADLPVRAADVNEERKGPRVGAPEKALEGFLKAAGLAKIEDAEIQKDPKGDFYVARISRKGRATAEIVAEAAPKIAKNFPWPKSMRSGSSDFTWVRPLHSVLCVFDGQPVEFSVGGVTSGVETRGHRFHSSGAITVKNAAEYEAKLRDAYVIVDREARKVKILGQASAICAARKLELVDDAGLLEELAGLSEWPVVVLGDMDKRFLDLPGEVIRLTMRTHQRYFAVRDPKTGHLAPHFITVANVEARDGGKAIAAGNARVLSARLNDARYFWDVDRFYDPIEKTRAKKLDAPERIEKLKTIVFHQKLGSVWDKVERVRALAKELAPIVGADAKLVDRAAVLSKCDLVTEVVGEFPELQGQIGRQLAELQGENKSVAVAVEDHYRPLGPNDRVPSDPVAITLALADKLDTLASFWAIDEKPTGSKDPFAIRRAALGIVRCLLESGTRLRLLEALGAWNTAHHKVHVGPRVLQAALGIRYLKADRADEAADLLRFVADRLKVQLRDQGKRHDLVDAVFALGDDDLVRIVARVEALDAFLKSSDGANLLAGYRRAANILAAEDKKGQGLSEADLSRPYDLDVAAKNPQPAEAALHAALARAGVAAKAAVEKESFSAAMAALSALRAPLDAFFEQVLVNDPNTDVRRNRLLLLAEIRAALGQVADFSKIEG